MIDAAADQRKAKPELLAPAGDWEALRAAVANGADAVYFGLTQFNARHRAANFEPEELPKIISFLHDHNVKGFVTLNTLIFSDELPVVAAYVKTIADAGVDAVIVQDLGLVHLIKRQAPTLPVHASTQMTLTEPRGIAYARKLGVERVVLARELSLNDIRKVTAAVDTPVEVFVHGALCVAYSGQCLTSEALGGRSANRGQCAQACRLPYELIVDGKRCDLGERGYLLSPQDLAAYELIDQLAEAGVISLKIEGRLKGAAYVAATTQTYRAAIDAAAQARRFTLSAAETRDLAQTFSRGFTPGFLEGVDHQRLVQGTFSKSRGNLLGTVISARRHGLHVKLHDEQSVASVVKAGDGIAIDTGAAEGQEWGGRVWKVEILSEQRAGNGPVILLSFSPDSDDLSAVKVGSKVWKTDDPALRKRLEQSYAADRPFKRSPLTVRVSGRVGGPLRISVQEAGHDEVRVEWVGPLEAAHTRPLEKAVIVEQFDRLMDTPFYLESVELDLLDRVMAPKSILNDLRRKAITQLLEIRESRHAIAAPSALDEIRNELRSVKAAGDHLARPRLNVLVRTLPQLETVCGFSADLDEIEEGTIYCDFEDPRLYRDAVRIARARKREIGLATLRIVKPGEEGFFKPIISAEPDAVLIRNIAGIEILRQALPSARLAGDFSLNVANEVTADLLMREGLSSLVPSLDLNWEQMSALVRQSHGAWFEPIIHQHMPMFHMEHCVFAAFLSSGKDHRDCGRPCDRHRIELRDRVNAEFPVLPDAGCRNTVFNSVAQSAAQYLTRMMAIGLRQFRVDLLREGAPEIGELLRFYSRALAGQDDGRATWRQLQALNQLGVTRGTLQLV